MCNFPNSACVGQDNGLMLGMTLAHETGHRWVGNLFKFLFESCREFKSLSIRITVFSNTQITWTILMSWGLLPYTRDSAVLIKKLRISYRK